VWPSSIVWIGIAYIVHACNEFPKSRRLKVPLRKELEPNLSRSMFQDAYKARYDRLLENTKDNKEPKHNRGP